MLWLQTGCFLAKLASSVWKRQVEVQQVIFKNCSRTGNRELTNNILPFSLMFYTAEQVLHFPILG